jgi:3-oxoacyl-[acyl-carrier protein] reductase
MPDRRTAIVTGSARGIGAAIARRLSRDGFAVAILDLDETACKVVSDEINDSGGEAMPVGVDVADEESVEQAVNHVAEGLGSPTVLVNNAGITRDNMLFKMSVNDWDSVMNVHLRGSFLMSRAAQKYKTLAIELGKFGITVNAIAPGFIETDMTASTATRMGISFEDFKAAAAKAIPVARVGQPEDIAATVSFFVRDEASFVSGQVIYVAGGPHA